MIGNNTHNINFWKDKRVFVTGATGIVGSWLVKDLIKQGAFVIVLIRDNDPQSELYRSGDIHKVNVINGKLEDYSSLDRAINEYEVDSVFHLAAQPIVNIALRNPLPTFEANIRGTYNLLEACRIHKNFVKRIVIASSDKAYGDQKLLPYIEDMPLQGRYPYEVSKSCADLISQTYFYTYDLPISIARCGNIYGGGDFNWSRIIPGTIRSFLKKEQPIIRSDGKFIRDYIYIKDITQAYLKLAENLDNPLVKGQAFNFGPKQPLSVLEIVSWIRKLMNAEDIEPIILNQVKNEILEQYLNSQKALDVLDWKSKYTIEQGLSETITWYRDYFGSKNH